MKSTRYDVTIAPAGVFSIRTFETACLGLVAQFRTPGSCFALERSNRVETPDRLDSVSRHRISPDDHAIPKRDFH